MLVAVVVGSMALSMPQMRSRTVSTIPNMRTFGGIPCHGGNVMRDGVVYRSASPANATNEDIDVLCNSLNLRSVIDLRAQKEGEKDIGPRLLQSELFPVRPLPVPVGTSLGEGSEDEAHPRATYHINLLDDGILRKGVRKIALGKPRLLATLVLLGAVRKVSPSSRLRRRLGVARDIQLANLMSSAGLDRWPRRSPLYPARPRVRPRPPTLHASAARSVYEVIMEERGEEIRQVLSLCADPSVQPLLLHCTHGKDRTGVVSALLQHICGVPRDQIIDDYALSNEVHATSTSCMQQAPRACDQDLLHASTSCMHVHLASLCMYSLPRGRRGLYDCRLSS